MRRLISVFSCLLIMLTLCSCDETPSDSGKSRDEAAAKSSKQSQVAESDKGTSAKLKKAGKTENVKLAAESPIKFFQKALKQYDAHVKCYTLIMYEQERIRGDWGKREKIAVKFMENPFSVYMKWLENPSGADKVIYVEGKYKDSKGVSQMVVQPDGGFLQLVTGGSVLRLPTSEDVMKNNLFPITSFGLRLELFDYILAMKEADKIKSASYAYKGLEEIDGKACAYFEIVGPDRKPFFAPKKVIYVELKTLLPVRVDYFEKDGKLRAQFSFTDIKLNAGLTAKDFLPSNNGIKGRD